MFKLRVMLCFSSLHHTFLLKTPTFYCQPKQTTYNVKSSLVTDDIIIYISSFGSIF